MCSSINKKRKLHRCFGPKMETNKRIAIIGAGISGLMACKYTLEKGFSPIVFEATSGIGGVWTQTIESTKLQSPKDFYQFSDFSWPPAVKGTYPDHNQVLEYLQAYALQFNILPWIKFNSKVTCIDYVTSSTDDVLSWDLWGGSGDPFSSSGKWNVTVRCALDPSAPTQEYQVDFVILCLGKYSDLPNIPEFPLNKGPEVFNGKVLHSMDYAAMDGDLAAELIKEKRVIVIGFQKSAVDIAAEVASKNGASHPCTLMFKTVHWTVPEYLLSLVFRCLNRFTELIVHKPGEGFFYWLLALLLSPLLRIFSTSIECYLKCVYPLKKYNMKCISGSSAPFYRECIHPRIPHLAILGYADSPAILYSTEMRSKWLAHFLAGNFRLPTISKMEEDVLEWEKYKRSEEKEHYRKSCVSALLQIYCNDQLCKDMGCNSRRKNWFLAELFVTYGPKDYKAVS